MRSFILLSVCLTVCFAYPNTVLDPKNIETQVWTTVKNPYYGLHVFALGANKSIYHKFQTAPFNGSDIMPTMNFSDWHVLVPNASMTFDTAPGAAVNADGRIEVFSRYTGFIDLWQIYQKDPTDPLSWSPAREGTCMCAAVDPNDCPWCVNCKPGTPCDAAYFCDHAPFPTSAASAWLGEDKKINVIYRGFDGFMYTLAQKEAGNPAKYEQIFKTNTVFE